MQLNVLKIDCKNERDMPTCWSTSIGGVDGVNSEVANSYYSYFFTGKHGVFLVMYLRHIYSFIGINYLVQFL